MIPAQPVAVDLENFQQVFIEQSKEKTVFVVFWAPGYESSQNTIVLLQQLLASAGEQIMLTTVDCQQFPQIAQQFGVQALPTVAVVKDGQPIDGFADAQTDEFINEFVQKYVPQPWQIAQQQAQQLMQAMEFAKATELLKQYIDDSAEDVLYKEDYISCLLETNDLDLAQQILGTIEFIQQSERYTKLTATLELKQQALDSPELVNLETALHQEPENKEIQLQLAIAYSQVNKYTQALELLLAALRKDRGLDEFKKAFIDIIKQVDASTAATYQRKLYTLYY